MKNRKKPASTGSGVASRPMARDVAGVRALVEEADQRNRAPVSRPWLNMTRMAPSMPWALFSTAIETKMPSVTKPMWLTLE